MCRVRMSIAVLMTAVLVGPVWGQRADYSPPELSGIEIQDKSGDTIPRDLEFVDEHGQAVVLSQYLDQGKPLVVQLLYFDCPMLCNLVLNGFVEGASGLGWKPGTDYTVLSVSFDPKDTPETALLKKKNYVESLGAPEADAGWHFLTGDEKPVKELADALGFPYRYLPKQEQFSHGAGIFVLTPSGKISRTLYGIEFPTQTLKFSLMEASKGRLGSALDKVVLYCFHYNPDSNSYGLVAVNVMKLSGALTALVLGAVLVFFWSREKRTRAA